MEKKEFYTLLSNYTSLSAKETDQVISLQAQFPYSQVIQGMAARATQDNQFADRDHQLHLSAIYSTDRAVLKLIMTSLKQSRKPAQKIETPKPEEKVVNEKEVVEETISVKAESLVSSLAQSKSVANESFYAELRHDLETLKERKHQFEEAVSNLENGIPFIEETKAKREKISDPGDGLLKEIKTTKKKIKPEGPKQKEQIEIIDQFIKAQPTISKNKLTAKETPTSKEDLIEENLTYGENIVSETLVHILLKQGKKEKAIEVLKKLIWKFPQKKAYFAAQIEDLKK